MGFVAAGVGTGYGRVDLLEEVVVEAAEGCRVVFDADPYDDVFAGTG